MNIRRMLAALAILAGVMFLALLGLGYTAGTSDLGWGITYATDIVGGVLSLVLLSLVLLSLVPVALKDIKRLIAASILFGLIVWPWLAVTTDWTIVRQALVTAGGLIYLALVYAFAGKTSSKLDKKTPTNKKAKAPVSFDDTQGLG